MKTTLNATTLDQIAGGYLSGNLNDQPFTFVANSDGTYQLNVEGQDPMKFTKDQVTDILTKNKFTPDQIAEAFTSIESSENYDVGDWYINNAKKK